MLSKQVDTHLKAITKLNDLRYVSVKRPHAFPICDWDDHKKFEEADLKNPLQAGVRKYSEVQQRELNEIHELLVAENPAMATAPG